MNNHSLQIICKIYMSSQESNIKKVMEEIETKTEKKIERLFLNKDPIYEIKTDPLSRQEPRGFSLDNTCILSSSSPEYFAKLGDTLVNIMSEGAEEFKEKTGRPMTYSEMRQMYG